MKYTTTIKRKGHKSIKCNAKLVRHYDYEFKSAKRFVRKECVGQYGTGPDGSKYLIEDVTNKRHEDGTYTVVLNLVKTEVPKTITVRIKETK